MKKMLHLSTSNDTTGRRKLPCAPKRQTTYNEELSSREIGKNLRDGVNTSVHCSYQLGRRSPGARLHSEYK